MDKFLSELSELILHGVSPAQYVAAFFMCIVGVLASLYVSSLKRKTENGENPSKFSKTYLIVNNLQRIAGSILATFVLIRLSNTAFDANTTIAIAAGIGYSADAGMNALRKLEGKVAPTVTATEDAEKPLNS